MQIDWTFIGTVAIIVIGFIEWLKKLLTALPPQPGRLIVPVWVWPILMLACAAVFSWLFAILPPWIKTGALVFAVIQLGYDNIIKLVQSKLGVAPPATGP
jgi:hypothetical protein